MPLPTIRTGMPHIVRAASSEAAWVISETAPLPDGRADVSPAFSESGECRARVGRCRMAWLMRRGCDGGAVHKLVGKWLDKRLTSRG